MSASRAAILRRRAQLFAELAQLELELAGLEEPARVVEAHTSTAGRPVKHSGEARQCMALGCRPGELGASHKVKIAS